MIVDLTFPTFDDEGNCNGEICTQADLTEGVLTLSKGIYPSLAQGSKLVADGVAYTVGTTQTEGKTVLVRFE
jgi:hypothetical protein